MPVWTCLGCGCRYAVGLAACPQCGTASSRPVRGRYARAAAAGAGPAVNVDTGVETPAGQPLPEVETTSGPELVELPDGVEVAAPEVDPAPKRRRKAS